MKNGSGSEIAVKRFVLKQFYLLIFYFNYYLFNAYCVRRADILEEEDTS